MAEGGEDSIIVVQEDSVILVDTDLSDIDFDSPVVVNTVPGGGARRRQNQSSQLEDTIAERKRQEQENIDRMYTKRDVEKAHSAYLRNNVSSSPIDQREARLAASFWASKHGLKNGGGKRTVKKNNQLLSPSPGTPTSSQGGGRSEIQIFHCPVVNCQVEFSSKGMFDLHMTMMQHSPCHPYNHLINRELLQRITTHVCPVCSNTYRSRETCREHMVAARHDLLMEPLPVGGYACPTCLKMYPEKRQCQVHMDSEDHRLCCHPFPDDDPETSAPVPLPVNVIKKYLHSCLAVEWHVECLMCARTLLTNLKEDKIHHKTTRHTLMAFSDTSATEAFGPLLRSYTCVQCLRLFDKLPLGGLGDIHQCSEDIVGMIIESDCKTFTEFILRLGVSLDNEVNTPAAENGGEARGFNFASGHVPEPSGSGELLTRNPRKAMRRKAQAEVISIEESPRTTPSQPAALGRNPAASGTVPCDSSIPTFASLRRRSFELDDSSQFRRKKTCVEMKSLANHVGQSKTAGKDGPQEILDINENASNSNVAGTSGAHSQPRKTQEELDMEFALTLAQQFAQEDDGSDAPATSTSQIDKDHEFARALAQRINKSLDGKRQTVETPVSRPAAQSVQGAGIEQGSSHRAVIPPGGITNKRQGDTIQPAAKRCRWDKPPERGVDVSHRVSPPTAQNSILSKRRAVSGDQSKLRRREGDLLSKKRVKSGPAVTSQPPGVSKHRDYNRVPSLVEMAAQHAIAGGFGSSNNHSEKGASTSGVDPKGKKSTKGLHCTTSISKHGDRTTASQHKTTSHPSTSATMPSAKATTSSGEGKGGFVIPRVTPPGPEPMPPVRVRTTPPGPSHPVRDLVPQRALTPPLLHGPALPPGLVSAGTSGIHNTSGQTQPMYSVPSTSHSGQLPSTFIPRTSALVPYQPPFTHRPYPIPVHNHVNVPNFLPGRACFDSFIVPRVNQPYNFQGGNNRYQPPRGNPRYQSQGRGYRGRRGGRGGRLSPRPPEPEPTGPPEDPSGLPDMMQIVFLDIDNWVNFFNKLPAPLPDKTFIWGFQGGQTDWYEPRRSAAFDYAKSKGLFHLHRRCGVTKDAADFAIALTVGRMDSILPPSVAFTVLSGDKGFCEMEQQMKHFARRVRVVNPHHKDQVEIFALIKSVGEA